MKSKQFVTAVFLLVLAMLCSTRTALAISDDDNDTGYSRRQILKMGLSRFTDLYCAQPQHRKHPSESAAALYRHYKKPDNLRRIARLPSRRMRQIKPFYTSLESWEETAWELRCHCHGGGTAWISDMIYSSGELEEFLGQVIGCYEPHRQHPRRRFLPPARVLHGSTLLLKRCEKLLAQNNVARTNDFRRDLALFRKQTATLNKALVVQSPAVQRIVARHLTTFAQSVME